MDRVTLLLGLSCALFAFGLIGVVVRRNALIMLMCMELMLNGVNLALVTFSQQHRDSGGAVLVFLTFVVATAEIALAIPILLLLVKAKRSMAVDHFSDLNG
jgi:NADH-quinone oxidoreductase subunit K